MGSFNSNVPFVFQTLSSLTFLVCEWQEVELSK